jgi:hypothetical protein
MLPIESKSVQRAIFCPGPDNRANWLRCSYHGEADLVRAAPSRTSGYAVPSADAIVARLFMTILTGRCGDGGRLGQQSFCVLIEVACAVIDELAADVAAVPKGSDGATAVSPGLIACSGVGGCTSVQAPASPELSVRTAYSSSFWVL